MTTLKQLFNPVSWRKLEFWQRSCVGSIGVRSGGRFGQDFKNSGKTCRYVWASFLSRTITLQNSHIRFPQSSAKIRANWKFPPLASKVPVCLWLELCTIICWGASLSAVIRGVTTGVKGHNSPGAEKSQQCHKYFSAVYLLPKDLRFENGDAELASCPERHLASSRSCQSGD